jgi:hypothetical protein
MTLGEVLDAAAAMVGVEPTGGDGAETTWASGGIVYAVLGASGAAASFRLDAVLAAAARRTPDAGPSDRGDEWVTFAPQVVDAHAVDRATAWFLAAARRAGS